VECDQLGRGGESLRSQVTQIELNCNSRRKSQLFLLYFIQGERDEKYKRFVLLIFALIAGFGLRAGKAWGRVIGGLTAFISLFEFPIGTFWGI
jgi:hypothetical protein